MSRLPSLNALHAFEVTARLGTIVAAARSLHVTASAVSHQLRRLEEDLGVRLMERGPRRLSLTPAGEAYRRELARAFEQIKSATDHLRQLGVQRAVSVTTVPTLAIKWLVPRLADFHRGHPDIDVRIGTSYRVEDLRRSDSDLGIRWGRGEWPGVHSLRLLDDAVQPVCSPALLRGRKRPRKAEEMLEFRLIEMSLDRDDWGHWFEAHGISPRRRVAPLRFGDPLSALQAAVDGLGLALGPTSLVHDDIAGKRLVALLGKPLALPDAYYVVHTERLARNPPAAVFRDWLVDTARDFMRAAVG